MTHHQEIIWRIADAAGARERDFQRATGATWNEAYQQDWRVAHEIYLLAMTPAVSVQFEGHRFMRRAP